MTKPTQSDRQTSFQPRLFRCFWGKGAVRKERIKQRDLSKGRLFAEA